MPISELSALLGCLERQAKSLFAGRSFAVFEQISILASRFNISVADILLEDAGHYNEMVAHCINQFEKAENREYILNIIDDYIDVLDATSDTL